MADVSVRVEVDGSMDDAAMDRVTDAVALAVAPLGLKWRVISVKRNPESDG